jgi:hypothetical protein
MTRIRFTIAQLIAIVLFAGVGFAALRSLTMLWASAIFTLTLAVLLIGVLGTMAHRGRARLTWAGFALFGWAYLFALFGAWPDLNGLTTPPLLTTRLLQQVGPQILGSAWSGPVYAGEETVAVAGVTVRSPKQFRRIGHCFMSLVFGLVSAGIGRTFAPGIEPHCHHSTQ